MCTVVGCNARNGTPSYNFKPKRDSLILREFYCLLYFRKMPKWTVVLRERISVSAMISIGLTKGYVAQII